MTYPTDFFYTEEHEYCKIEGDIATIGITNYAQDQLGDITYIELPEVGDMLEKNESFGSIEAVKAASDINAPISGEVIEINEELEDNPELINQDPHGKGWIVKVKISDKSELDNLMKSEEYKNSLS